MSIGSDETIADILTEMREFADKDSQSIGRDVLRRRIQHFARRIEQSFTDCNQFGNAAAMRKALSDACYAMFNFLKTQNGGYEEMSNALDKAKAALAKPPRNCDVGTADEQAKRFHSSCKKFQSRIQGMCSSLCPCIDCCDVCHCMTKWSQMPYKEGGAE